MSRKIANVIVTALAVLLFGVLMADIWIMFSQTRELTREAGISTLNTISRQLEESVTNAKLLTMKFAVQAADEQEDIQKLTAFVRKKKEEALNSDTGAFNVYMAGPDLWIIPDFDAEPDFKPKERVWYNGAIRMQGQAYVSSPYQDFVTDNFCYAVSVMLPDGETVLGVDYSLDVIQKYVVQLNETGNDHAVIVTEDGIIAGCSEQELIGQPLLTALPKYSGIWSLSKRQEGVVSARIHSGLLYENLFAAKAGSGFFLIVSVSDWGLYRISYLHLLITAALFAAFCVAVTGVFMSAKRKESRKGEDVLQRRQYQKKKETHTVNKRYRNWILGSMILVMMIGFYSIVSATSNWGKTHMQKEAEQYENNLSKWVNTQKSILDMFVSIISSNPSMLEDYQETVRFLNDITVQFPEISVSYMTCPDREPSVFMNNGWQPQEGWSVSEKSWYTGALASDLGWYMTAPYYDQQTGGYCVTISEQVHDAKSDEFLGVFGIDFYMDKLVDILGDSYSEGGYAFLVDIEGNIINHPYGKYQMSEDSQTSILQLPYGTVKTDGRDNRLIQDYDGSWKILIARQNEASRFSVYVVTDALRIYGRVLLYSLLSLAAFMVCIIMIYRLLSGMIAWQNEVNAKLEHAAKTDAMTGLFNKASAEEAISQAVKQGSGSLLVIDLDSFKLVNDLHSHEMGDRLLVRFSELIQSVIRDGDIAGRIGGDEFAVYLNGLNDEDTIRKKCAFLNDEIIKAGKELLGEDMDIPIGCSVGASIVPEHGREYSELFEKADYALHQVKKNNRHDVRVYHEEKREETRQNDGDLSRLQMIFGERNVQKTAIVTDRESFQNIYQTMVRMALANHWDLHLIEFTLNPESDADVSELTDRFLELCSNQLRNCDVLLKYSSSQVLLLLLEPENRDFMIPVQRILDAWNEEGNAEGTVSFHQELISVQENSALETKRTETAR